MIIQHIKINRGIIIDLFFILDFFYSVVSKINEDFSYLSCQIHGVRDNMNLREMGNLAYVDCV